MCIPFTGIAQFPDVAHNLEILQDQEDCDESERSGKKDSGECRHAARNCFKRGQTGHLQQDGKKDTTASTSGHAVKENQIYPDVSLAIFADISPTYLVIFILSNSSIMVSDQESMRKSFLRTRLLTFPSISCRVSSILDSRLFLNPDEWVFPEELIRNSSSPRDKFVIMLIDDILIFSKSNEEHEDHLRTVIQILRQEKLYAKFSKCKFWLSKVVFLGHVVPAEGITMDPAKVEVVTKWPRSTSETEARSFLGLAGHYHRVVEGSSRLALPLTKLTRKDEKLYGPESERRSLKNLSNV
ncbi:putative reverse transcriptase domain-containing protein [Tanacetum coccineum]|uniref:Reverse transcriptase domain-containing protein n=1 Tax=Tanacetum coccineum TaxID=301880 RepID=A0ABQ5BLZ6_9ASTR